MAKPRSGALKVWWCRRERDLRFSWDRHRPDGHLLHGVFAYTPCFTGRTFWEELEARGFDITTLRFSIERKKS